MSAANSDDYMQVIVDMIIKFIINGALNGSTQGQVAVGEKIQYALQQSLQGKLNYKAANKTVEDVSQAQTDYTPSNVLRACRIMEDSTLDQNAGVNADLDAKASAMVMADEQMNPPSDKPKTQRAAEFLDKLDETYCAKEDIDLGRCKTITRLPNAHVQVTTLYNMPEEYGESSYSPEQYAAAKDFIKMLTEPVAKDVIPIALEKTDAGKQYRLRRMVNSAYMSFSTQGLTRIAGARAPGSSATSTE